MLSLTTINAFSENAASLTDFQILQAREIVVFNKQARWKTRCEIQLFEKALLHDEMSGSENPEYFEEFISTAWDVVDGAVVIRSEDTLESLSTSCGTEMLLRMQIQSPEELLKLSYFDADALDLIPHPHNYNTPSVIKPPLAVHRDTPESLVDCYMHPSMPQFCPRSLLNPSGIVDSGSPPPKLSAPAHRATDTIDHARWLHMRVAWLVPIRGVAPWCGTSQGRVLVDDEERTKSPYAKSKLYTQPIMWTPSLLQAFWKYLIRHRKRNTLGPLAFALIPATKEASLPDLIKVWCDAEMAMKVRTLLSVFYVEPPEVLEMSEDDSQVRKSMTREEEQRMREDTLITPLRRCRLVLLDDTGEPLLIS